MSFNLNNEVVGLLYSPKFYAASDKPDFPVGSRYRMDDRVFHYAKAGGTLNTDLGCKSYNRQHVAYTTIAADANIGDTGVVLDIANTAGAAGNGNIAKDELVNGYIVIFPHNQNAINRRIVGNTAVVGGGEMIITLDYGIPVALDVDADHGECMASPYLDVRSDTSADRSVIGIPVVAAKAGQYLWVQTWGPIWIAPQGEVSVGNNNRQVVFRHDGSVDEHDYNDANVAKAQHAGFVLQNAGDGGQGAAFIMLQICP